MTENKRALIATHHLVDYAGSEIFTLELASALTSMGWDVTVAAMLIGEPMCREFQLKSIALFNLLEEQLPIDGQQFDLIWMHHLPVFHEIVLFRGITGSKIIYCSLSPFEPLEAVPFLYGPINVLLANSRENADHILQRMGLPENAVTVFPNSVPQDFFEVPKSIHLRKENRIALISNHPPDEILELVLRLEDTGKEVRHIGWKGKPALVTPHMLKDCDAVITIGRTVQYCFALKIPVYCYDRFGGPGWLNNLNFELAYHNNFSGRGFQRKDSDTIFQELERGYASALEYIDKHYEFALAHCHLENNLNRILSCELSPLPPFAGPISQEFIPLHACYRRLANAHNNSANIAKINILQAEIRRLMSSYSWQVTKPLRLLANLPRLTRTALRRILPPPPHK